MARRPGYISPLVARRAMRRQGLSTATIAVRLDVGASTVRGWLAGTGSPAPHKLRALAEMLKLDTAELAGIVRGEETLDALRVLAGFTQQQAADLVGLSQSGLSGVERGLVHPSDEMVDTLALVYGTSAQTVREAWSRTRDTH